jgi:hypothetical protein
MEQLQQLQQLHHDNPEFSRKATIQEAGSNPSEGGALP